MAENLTNDFATTLSSSMADAVTTTCNATSNTGAPAPNFRIRIDNELMLVTSTGTGLNWTVTRGIESTTAAAHSSGAIISHVLSKGGLDQYLTEKVWGTAQLGTSGTADARSFLRGDQVWSRSWNVIAKSADQAKTSNTTLAADTDLQFAVTASKSYHVRFSISGTFLNIAGLRYRFTGPASPTLVTFKHTIISASLANTITWNTAFDSVDRTFTTAAEPFNIDVDMLFQNGTNAGTLAFQWAQQNSNVNATTINKGSVLEYTQVD